MGQFLAARIVQAQGDTALQPWTILGPESEPSWPAVVRSLSVALRARDVLPSDTAFDLIEFLSVSLESETKAVVRFGHLHIVRCSQGREFRRATLGAVEIPRTRRFRRYIWGNPKLVTTVNQATPCAIPGHTTFSQTTQLRGNRMNFARTIEKPEQPWQS